MLKKVIGHFTTITRHKILVMKECFKIGLYKQGLTHDLSKYSPTEFLVGCKYYQGNRSPNNAEKRPAYPKHGCITKDATAIILNTGSITVWKKTATR